MEDIDKISDDLLHKIMQMENEINKILVLNGNKEDRTVKQYRQFIVANKNKLKKLNNNYDGLLD